MMFGPSVAVGLLVAAADSGGSAFDPYSLLTSAGVAGVFATAFALGKIRSKSEVDDLREDRDEARTQLTAMVTKFLDEIVPLMTQTNDSLARSNEVLQRALRRERGDD